MGHHPRQLNFIAQGQWLLVAINGAVMVTGVGVIVALGSIISGRLNSVRIN